MADPIDLNLSAFDQPTILFGLQRVKVFSTAHLLRLKVATMLEIIDLENQYTYCVPDESEWILTAEQVLEFLSETVDVELQRRVVGRRTSEPPDRAYISFLFEAGIESRIWEAVDMVTLIQRHSGHPPAAFVPFDDVIVGPCPMCHSAGNRSVLMIDPGHKLWHCPTCGDGGSPFHFVYARYGLDVDEANRFLAHELGIPYPNDSVRDGEDA